MMVEMLAIGLAVYVVLSSVAITLKAYTCELDFSDAILPLTALALVVMFSIALLLVAEPVPTAPFLSQAQQLCYTRAYDGLAVAVTALAPLPLLSTILSMLVARRAKCRA